MLADVEKKAQDEVNGEIWIRGTLIQREMQRQRQRQMQARIGSFACAGVCAK